ncbi:MAG: lytic transglycosylase domain-containing protein [SAR116 cluster bacterium]|nr:MAG: lytic transglycosylase domain-containing protein [SAR116 cluster bacterium]|tara:strand:+ start:1464 stop:2426 length:963 start_codon:yes stop_codon:yes gene_type:complete
MVRRILNTLGVAAICLFAGQEAAAGVPDCKAIARAAEERHGLPDGILQSISTVEASRIQPDGSYRAWPWTLNDNGKGLFFDDPEQVLDYLDTHMTNPDTSIDIGCMQINTKWHGASFETLDEMLDPASNIAYAAGFLTDLYYAHGSWNDAIRHYHSSDQRKNDPYLNRVLAIWTKRHPNAQDAEIQAAVFQLPLEPLSTATDDAFARAMQEADKDLTEKEEGPASQPVVLPVALPVAKPVVKPASAATAARAPTNPGGDLRPVKPKALQASAVAGHAVTKTVRPTPEPADPDHRVKQRQRNLVGQWDKVLMFRAQFANIR